ncbi:DUF3039 domain-containing protein [Nocardioides daphniae]|uniref:DUF3039 domain-containing protein n=1 Tax=Nocardioides daphniae TaxID=402297 RepID=A0A4P7UDF8_9ACTN|nr:DUF3039 domain-containing protein [Nocardioides daphniae]QCC77581.1 DUF3039 domain-containing protein [Nocardioides daphniae]
MNSDGRPTLRCLKDDLPNDWESASDNAAAQQSRVDKPLPELGHPIIRKAAADFPAERAVVQPARESISGLSDPVWWKVKIGGRWRGAVWEDPETGQGWLCAAGYRREREASDFYKGFMAAVAAKGPDIFLPTDEDRALLKRELQTHTLDEWSLSLQELVRSAALTHWESFGEAQIDVMHPIATEKEIALVTVTVDRETIDDEVLLEILISIECVDYAHLPLVQWAELVALSAVDRREQRWRSLPIAGVPTHSQVLEGMDVDAVAYSMSQEAIPGLFELGDTAHFAHTGRLVESIIEGEGVKSLCGAFFVPRQDHQDLPKCPHCTAIHNAMSD